MYTIFSIIAFYYSNNSLAFRVSVPICNFKQFGKIPFPVEIIWLRVGLQVNGNCFSDSAQSVNLLYIKISLSVQDFNYDYFANSLQIYIKKYGFLGKYLFRQIQSILFFFCVSSPFKMPILATCIF